MQGAGGATAQERHELAEKARTAQLNDHSSAARWCTNGAIGFVCGLIAFFLKESVAALFRFRSQTIDSVIGSGAPEQNAWVLSVWVHLIVFAVALVTVSAAVIIFFEPHAAGSGIP